MKVYTDLSQLPTFINPVITIGTFDGVHFGHRKIINQLKTEAKKIGGKSVIITFQPHPRLILQPENTNLKLLSSLPEKIKLFEELGVDILIVAPFTLEFSRKSAMEYLQDFLINTFHPHTLIIGHDHHFGNAREGNFGFLEKNKLKFNYQLIEISSVIAEEIIVSSTAIRKNIEDGNLPMANKLLEYNYSVTGKVVKGNQLGRTIGYATANILVEDALKLIPENGVYIVEVLVENSMCQGMLNIGFKPTIGNHLAKSIEVHIFNFNQDIYGKPIKVNLLQFLRGEQKFSGVQELAAQIGRDVVLAKQVLAAQQ